MDKKVGHMTAQLKEMQERFRIVAEAITDHAIIRTDDANNIVDWTKGAENIIGYARDEVLGLNASLLFTPEDRQQGVDLEEIRTARETGRAEDNRWMLKRDGERFFANGIVNPVRNDHDHVIGYVKIFRDATQAQKHQDALVESDLRYRLATRATRSIIWDWNLVSDGVVWNEALSTELGYDASDQTSSGGWWKERIHPDDIERVTFGIHAVINSKTETIWSDEYRFRANDGTYRVLWDRGSVIRDTNGTPTRMIGAMEDVSEQRAAAQQAKTERERAEHARKAIEQAKATVENERENFRNLFRLSPEMICVLQGPEHIFEFVNKAHMKVLGFDATGKSVREAQPESVEVHGILDDVYRTGKTAELHEIPVTVGNRLRYFNLTYAAKRDSQGNTDGIMILGSEVTEQVDAKRILQENEKILREFLDAVPVQLWSAEPDGTRDFFNKVWSEYTGQDPLLEPGRAWIDLLHPEDRSRVLKEWQDAVESGTPITQEFRMRRASDDTYHWHITRAAPVRNSNGEVIKWAGATSDIESLKQAEQAAENANRSKSAFLANMSHEIRTPMTAVLGFTELLRDFHLTDEEREDAISRIESSGRSLLRVIDDVLDISKIEAGKITIQKSYFSPVGIGSEVISMMRLTAEQKGVSIGIKVDLAVPNMACSDPARLRQILINLVGNAVKFTLSGEVFLHIKAQHPSTLIFEVNDTGIGIAKADQSKLFQPFAQADESITRKFGGTGLGLLLSRRLAEQLGGSLDLAESVQGKGSRFIVKINAAPFQISSSAPEPAPSYKAQESDPGNHQILKNVRVLLVEDVTDNQVLMRRYLTGAGASVSVVTNGEEAIEQAERSHFDVVLMDIQMPKVDGIQATKELRARGYRKPILALTAHAMNEEFVRSLEAGCNAHLTKPIAKNILIEAVREHTKHLHL